MADAKISALPIASVQSSDVIPFTVVSTSVTSGVSYNNFFNTAFTTIGGVTVTGAASALGYAAGAGGTVTQSIGGTKEQAVSLNRAVGKIILSNSVMAASVLTSVLFGNSVMGVNDILAINYIGNGLAGTNMRSYLPSASMVAPGSAIITIKSQNNFADTSSVFLGFAVIKGSIS